MLLNTTFRIWQQCPSRLSPQAKAHLDKRRFCLWREAPNSLHCLMLARPSYFVSELAKDKLSGQTKRNAKNHRKIESIDMATLASAGLPEEMVYRRREANWICLVQRNAGLSVHLRVIMPKDKHSVTFTLSFRYFG
jgi:hypothetical protein